MISISYSYSGRTVGYDRSIYLCVDYLSRRTLDRANYWKRSIWRRVRFTLNLLLSSPPLSCAALPTILQFKAELNRGVHAFNFGTVLNLLSRVTSRTILVYSGIFTFLVDAYPTYAASALAANSFMRSSFGGIFPLFGIQSEFLPTPCPYPASTTCDLCISIYSTD